MGAGDDLRRLIPAPLRPGDEVAFVAPSKPVSAEDWAATEAWWQEQGFVPVAFFNPFSRWGMFADDDLERARFLQAALDSPTAKAVVCLRGGYGVNRIIDKLNWDYFARFPKWVCGFSDATPLLNTAAAVTVAVHGAMFGGFAADARRNNHAALLQALTGFYPPSMRYDLPPHPLNRTGNASGRLMGGNLALIHSNLGAPSEIPTADVVLFIEEVGEYLYNIDRMLGTLRRAGKLKNLKALVVGTFTDLQDNDPAFGASWEEIVRQAVEDYAFPVAFGVPAGHGAVNLPLYLGADVQISVGKEGTSWQYA